MSSTNKTTYYNLSQYISTDKPTYAADYNTDMQKIDAGIHEAKDIADTNSDAIGTLANLGTTVKTDLVSALNEAYTAVVNNTSNIGDLSTLGTTVKTDLVSSINEVNTKANNISSYYDVKNYNSLTNFEIIDVTTQQILTPTITNNLYSALNDAGSYGKVYGSLTLSNLAAWPKVTIKNSGIMGVESPFNIIPAGLVVLDDGTVGVATYTIEPAGSGETSARVVINIGTYKPNVNMRVVLFPCIYYFTDFGNVS